MMLRAFRFSLAAALAFAVSACGDSGLIVIDDPSEDGGTVDAGPSDPVRLLEVISTQPTVLAPNGRGPLTVQLTEDGAPIVDALVRFLVLEPAGGSSVSAARATTDGRGEATVDVVAGGSEVQFNVSITAEGASDALALVRVVAPAQAPASLRVNVEYRAQPRQPIQKVAVSVYDATVTCAHLLAGPAPTAIETKELLDLAGAVTFTDFEDGDVVTIGGVGHNAVAAVADGCVEGIELVGGTTTVQRLPLDPRSIDITGTYQMEHKFDMTGAVPGTAGDVIGSISTMFDDPDDPARFLVDMVEDKTGNSFGAFKDTAISLIDQAIRNWAPAGFLNFVEYMREATQVVSKLTFEGPTVIAAVQDGHTGSSVWENVVFKWRGGCDTAIDPGCDIHRIALRNTHIAPIESLATVSEANGVLTFEPHSVSIPYARFFHLFILQVIYPQIVPGATNTGDVLNEYIDCAAVGQYIADADGETADGVLDLGVAQIGVDVLSNYCSTGLNYLGQFADEKLDDLAADLPSELTLAGAAAISDADRDLEPEALQNGAWTGDITVDGEAHSVSGIFSGQRIR